MNKPIYCYVPFSFISRKDPPPLPLTPFSIPSLGFKSHNRHLYYTGSLLNIYLNRNLYRPQTISFFSKFKSIIGYRRHYWFENVKLFFFFRIFRRLRHTAGPKCHYIYFDVLLIFITLIKYFTGLVHLLCFAKLFSL